VTWLALSLWAGPALRAVIYLSDYLLSLLTVRRYRQVADSYIRFEGSMELSPAFQADLDSLRLISPRFVAALIISLIGLVLIRWLTIRFLGCPSLYLFTLGGLLLREAAIHLRHLRNLAFYSALRQPDAVSGHLAYSQPLMLRLSSSELLPFAGFFLLLALAGLAPFFLGGTFACGVTSWQHMRLAQRAIAKPVPST
jgi:hypothetical protein